MNFRNLISPEPKDNIQINNINDMTRELAPIINSLVIKSTSKKLDMPFEKFNNNHSDKPRWLISGKFKLNVFTRIVSK